MPFLRPIKKIREVTPDQLKKFKAAKTVKGKYDALEVPVGKRADITIKKDVIKRLWKTEHLVTKRAMPFSVNRKFIEALADHIAGETIVDAALKYGLQPHKLNTYKKRFMQADTMLPQFIEGLFEHAAVSALAIWNDKKHTLSAKDAALSAGIFAQNAINMRKARKTDYKDEQLTLGTLQRLGTILDKVHSLKTIDINAEVTQIEDAKN